MNTSSNFLTWRAERCAHIESWLNAQLPHSPSATQTDLWSAMRYALLGGGKRFRAILVYAGGELSQASPSKIDTLAGAVEALHAYSLVHDDLPCMDDDDLRRGKPTCHKVYGDAMALLAGDALHALAFEWVLSPSHDLPPAVALMIAQHFTHAIGFEGMVGGQAMDIASSHLQVSNDIQDGLSHLQHMHAYKTGALIAVSLYIGYLAGQSSPLSSLPPWLTEYAKNLGLLFQVVDDYLDATEMSTTLGKTAGKDARDGKLTYVSLLGLTATNEKINELLDHINQVLSLAHLQDKQRQRLMDIAQWVAQRDH